MFRWNTTWLLLQTRYKYNNYYTVQYFTGIIIGTGENINNWIIHLEGGGWCYSEDDCLQRSRTNLGSSTYWSSTAVYGGFLSDSPLANPDFYNWNMVFVKYCDGASFTGNL